MAIDYNIRLAEPRDFPRLAQMEREVWTRDGVDPFHEGHFASWVAEYPEGFYLAEAEGKIAGFTSLEIVDFNVRDPSAALFGTYGRLTGNGHMTGAHTRTGSHHYGLTICSQMKGCGHRLMQVIMAHAWESGKPLLGTSRLTGLSEYVKRVREGKDRASLAEIALHYLVANVKLAKRPVHPPLMTGFNVSRFPPVTVVDPILGFYLRYPTFTVYRLLPGFISDSPSEGYAVLFGQEGPP